MTTKPCPRRFPTAKWWLVTRLLVLPQPVRGWNWGDGIFGGSGLQPRSQVLVDGFAADAELAGELGFLLTGGGPPAQLGHPLRR